MSQKGFIPIFFIVGIIIASGAIVGGSLVIKQYLLKGNPEISTTPKPTFIPTPSSTPVKVNNPTPTSSITLTPPVNNTVSVFQRLKDRTSQVSPTVAPTPPFTLAAIFNLNIQSLIKTDAKPVPGFDSPKNYTAYQYGNYLLFTDIDKNEALADLIYFNTFRSYFKKNFFDFPDQLVNVYIFKNQGDYQFAQKCESQYGCYWIKEHLVISFKDSGPGTLGHELVHNFAFDGVKNMPDWFSEGLPTFFERLYGYYDDSKNLKLLLGFNNPWREQEFVSMLDSHQIQKPTLLAVAQHKSIKDTERLLSLYLYQKGWLKSYAQKVAAASSVDNDARLIMETSGKTLADLESDWSSWLDGIIANVKSPTSTLNYVPVSFILQDKKSWDDWYNQNKNNPLFTGKTPQ